MNIIVCTKRGRRHQLDLHSWAGRGLFIMMVAVVVGVIGGTGYLAGRLLGDAQPLAQIAELRSELDAQKAAVAEARQSSADEVNALSVRVGQLQAHIIRIDALGERLTQMAGLEEGEFDFRNPPGQGGPEVVEEDPAPGINLVQSLDALALQIEDREKQFSVLENLLINRNLQSQVTPAGRPVTSGWLSSQFGVRTDPFTGKRARHYGLDFAGARGSDIVAVASGVVTWSGPRYGYGKLVEINHGNGYATRYAHNDNTLVKVGDTVRKGQVIAKMGSTGRATAPHVHFEVLYNGKVVNPLSYITP